MEEFFNSTGKHYASSEATEKEKSVERVSCCLLTIVRKILSWKGQGSGVM